MVASHYFFCYFPTAYSAALRYAVHDSLTTCTFSGLFLLKIANLFPGEVELPSIISQVEQLAQLLTEVAAERYALTLRLMLANLRRKLGLGPSAPKPAPGPVLVSREEGPNALMAAGNGVGNVGGDGDTDMFGEGFDLGMEEFGFTLPVDGIFNPSTIPPWLREANFTDLGLPINGSDGIFLNGPDWSVDLGPMPEAW
jgi:hypothetical protein